MEDEPRAKPVRSPRAWHPLLFPAFPVLFLLARSITEQVSPLEAVRPLTIAVGVAALLFAALTPLLKSAHRAAIVVSTGALLFFSYGHVARLLRPYVLGPIRFGAHRFLTPLWLLIFGLVVFGVVKAARKLPRLTRALNVIALVLVLMNVASIAQGVVARRAAQRTGLEALGSTGEGRVSTAGPQRDIYYLIFDRYAGQRTLQKYYGFDNAEFLDGLREKGFFVPEETWAPYPRTTRSLAASLSLDYLTILGPDITIEQVYALYDTPRIGREMKARGYTTVNIGSWWEVTEEDPSADINVRLTAGSQFEDKLLEGTAVGAVTENVEGLGLRQREFNRLPRQFEAVEEVGRSKALTFTFAHFLLPHEPFIWDEDGRFLSRREVRRRGVPRNYLGQVVFANRKIMEVVEELLDVPEEEQPIIIIQSDEGPEPLDAHGDYIQAWESATLAQQEQKMRVLLAVYFPGLEESSLYETMSPVNIFRVLLNDYFDADLRLLPDRSYADTKSTVDITAKLRAIP